MMRKYAYLGLLIVIVALAVFGASSTAPQTTIAQPYVVGGEVEAPQASGGYGLIVGLIAAIAIILGVIFTIKMSR